MNRKIACSVVCVAAAAMSLIAPKSINAQQTEVPAGPIPVGPARVPKTASLSPMDKSADSIFRLGMTLLQMTNDFGSDTAVVNQDDHYEIRQIFALNEKNTCYRISNMLIDVDYMLSLYRDVKPELKAKNQETIRGVIKGDLMLITDIEKVLNTEMDAPGKFLTPNLTDHLIKLRGYITQAKDDMNNISFDETPAK